MGLPPDRNGGGQPPSTRFCQPNGSFAQVFLHDGNLNQACRFECPQVSGQGRLVQTGFLGKAGDRIILGRRDMSHQTELSDAQLRGPHLILQEVRDTARGEPNIDARTVIDNVTRVGDECSCRVSFAFCHYYMHIH